MILSQLLSELDRDNNDSINILREEKSSLSLDIVSLGGQSKIVGS